MILGQNGYLVSLFQVLEGLAGSSYVLAGKEFSRMVLQPYRFEALWIKAHFYVNELPIPGFTVDIESDLPVIMVFNLSLLFTSPEIRYYSATI